MLEQILPANTQLDDYEVEIDFPHIGKRTMLLNARRTYRQVNNTEAILLAFEDITDRKQLEKQKDDFIGIVSHELKTPLTSIKAFSQILEKYLEQNKDTKGTFFLSKIIKEIERLTQLTASFVNVYRIQTGKLELHKTKFVMDDLITDVVSDFQITTESHVIEWHGQSKTTIYADRERIMQVLVNLISNAVKYSPKAKKIIITSVSDTKKVIISITDFGFGIAQEEQVKIFDRFYRVKVKENNNISGLGLGLYISSEIIIQHKGRMWVKSIEGKGSTLFFEIPVK